jgi:hypothetical protein
MNFCYQMFKRSFVRTEMRFELEYSRDLTRVAATRLIKLAVISLLVFFRPWFVSMSSRANY